MKRDRSCDIQTDEPALPVLPVSVVAVWDLVKAASTEALWGLVELNIIMNMCQRQLAQTEYSNKYTQPSASGLACQWRMSPLSFANLLMLSPVWNYLLLSGSMNHCGVGCCFVFSSVQGCLLPRCLCVHAHSWTFLSAICRLINSHLATPPELIKQQAGTWVLTDRQPTCQGETRGMRYDWL